MILDPRGLAPRIANLDIYAWHVIDALREKSRIEQVVPGRGRPDTNHLGYAVPLQLRSPTASSRWRSLSQTERATLSG